MKKRRRPILLFFTIIIIAAGFAAWELFGPTIHMPPGTFFYIKTGSTYQLVKDNLATNRIVDQIIIFDKVARYFNYHQLIKAGKYKIAKGMSLINLVRMLRSGRQAPVNLVILKLRTKEDFARKLGDNFESDSNIVLKFIENNDSLARYQLDTNTVLTAIIPNTYTLRWNTSISKIFRRLYTEQQKFWSSERISAASALGLDTKGVYILASIVEEETNRQGDKGKIASVYLNRMRLGMRLAADPTVKFALRNFELKRVYFKHLSFPSPYNTYLNAGLPPGPICTPSIKTIDAVLHQPATDYLFFVAKPDFSGYSNFAAGYEEHKRNARAYQQALDSLILLKRGGN